MNNKSKKTDGLSKKIINALLYCGLEKETFNLNKDAFRRVNRKIVLGLSIIMMIIFYVIVVKSLRTEDFSDGSPLFPVGAVAFTLIVIISICDKKGKTTSGLSLLLRMVLYSYGLTQALLTNNKSVMICLLVFVCATPALFLARPITLIAEIAITNIVYLSLCDTLKPDPQFRSDKAWIVIYSIGGLCIAMVNLSQKIQNIENARLLKLQSEELEMQSEELEAQTVELQEAYARAEEGSKAKSLFLSNMSHEIRTPINAVLGLDEMIYRESSEENIRDYAYDLKSAGKTMLALINDLLDQSRLEAGKIDIIPVEYNIVDILNDLSNMISVKAVEKGLSFKMDIDESLPKKLIGDELRIKQIITNILTNSIKYTEKGEVIFKVSCTYSDDKNIILSVSVKDTGIGMKPEDLDKLFKPFEHIEEKRNKKIEGTGLGMSITQNLLLLMNSELKVESVYGSGSTFFFDVTQGVADKTCIGDYKEATKNVKHEAKRYQAKFTAPDAKILVVDDTVINLKVFAGLLKQTEICVETAKSGESALEMVGEKTYDIIFLDHMMPDMDGIETLHKMRELGVNTTVVALTANASPRSRQEYMSYGFDDYLSKPIDMERLEEIIIAYLQNEKIIRKMTQE